jgi:hypothetical protein
MWSRGQGGLAGDPDIVNGPIITHHDGGENGLPIGLGSGSSLRNGRG